MKKFWELFEQSIITQAVITFLLILTLCYLYATGQIVPDGLMKLTFLVVGFWFGSKIGYAQSSNKIDTLKKKTG